MFVQDRFLYLIVTRHKLTVREVARFVCIHCTCSSCSYKQLLYNLQEVNRLIVLSSFTLSILYEIFWKYLDIHTNTCLDAQPKAASLPPGPPILVITTFSIESHRDSQRNGIHLKKKTTTVLGGGGGGLVLCDSWSSMGCVVSTARRNYGQHTIRPNI
jgi:hypothetical protein